jgi:hypothetical protein
MLAVSNVDTGFDEAGGGAELAAEAFPFAALCDGFA